MVFRSYRDPKTATRRFSAVGLILILILSLATGCSEGPRTYPVRGIVQFSDGKLLRSGFIEFETQPAEGDAVLARGTIAPDGSFVLGTYALNDGALPGRHRVAVIADDSIGNGVERPELLSKSQLHPKHRRFRSSGIEVDVQPDLNEFLVEVQYADSDEQEKTEDEVVDPT